MTARRTAPARWTSAAILGMAGLAAVGGVAGVMSYHSTIDGRAGGEAAAYQQAYGDARDTAYAQARAVAEKAAATEAYRGAYTAAQDDAAATVKDRTYATAFKKAYISAFAQQAAEFRCEGVLPESDPAKTCLTEAWRLAEQAYARR